MGYWEMTEDQRLEHEARMELWRKRDEAERKRLSEKAENDSALKAYSPDLFY